MLSAISATRFAILLAMMAYAEVTPPTGASPWDEMLFALAAGRAAPARAAAVPFALGAPFARGAPFVRDTPLVRAVL